MSKIYYKTKVQMGTLPPKRFAICLWLVEPQHS